MALRICGSGALRWFLASGLALACTSSMAQDAKEAVAVEAAKVVAAPLSEQVTAIGTLLSDEAVTVSSEIPGRLKEIHFQEGQPVAKGAPHTEEPEPPAPIRIDMGYEYAPSSRLTALASLASRSHGFIQVRCEGTDDNKVRLVCVIERHP